MLPTLGKLTFGGGSTEFNRVVVLNSKRRRASTTLGHVPSRTDYLGLSILDDHARLMALVVGSLQMLTLRTAIARVVRFLYRFSICDYVLVL